ncbi:dihydrolipoamide acetyltransferase family protein [Agromyces silvae]|uniref:dihydrolipoamide acetyltransferase family protein n=1 Tax=Agromyces silvae TaxID=3388266 RepID=UPI00280B72AD|nr:dihydrolipoamide acetyltransferase family protein [Agromyces protaetiae]
MIRDFALPDLGEGLTESELIAWRVAVGERVELNQIIADVETAKAVVELPSPFAGVVTALHAEPGETVNVGERLFSCDTAPADGAPDAEGPGGADASGGADVSGGADASGGADVSGGADASGAGETPEPTLVGYGAAAERGPKRRARRVALTDDLVPTPTALAETALAETAHADDLVPGLPTPSTGLPAGAPHDAVPSTGDPRRAERPRSTPPVRKLARDLGVVLEEVVGTGERGLITRADVEAAAERRGGAPVAGRDDGTDRARQSPPGETRIPVKGVRKATAAAMVRSAFTAPHVTEFLTIDVTATMDLVRGIRDDRALRVHRVTPLAVVAKAVCIAARRTPEVNSRWDEDAGEIVRYEGLNLGIAVATERGLMVPNVRRADRMTLLDLADAIGSLAETAREGRTAPADLRGGTFSITNIGVFGIDAGTPILNPGEAAILATGAVRRQPWEHRGEIALRELMTLSLSFDHRLVDGEQGSRFLADVGAILRDPGRALLMS